MARSAEVDARAIVQMLVEKGVQSGEPYKNPMLVQNALWLGIEGVELDDALHSLASRAGSRMPQRKRLG